MCKRSQDPGFVAVHSLHEHGSKMFQGRLLYTIAPLIPRNYVVMEVKSNLLKSERQDLYQMDVGRSGMYKLIQLVLMKVTVGGSAGDR